MLIVTINEIPGKKLEALGVVRGSTVQYLQLGLRSFSVSPQNLLNVKKALLEL